MSFLLLVPNQTKPGRSQGVFPVFTRLIALFLSVLSLGFVQTANGKSVSPIDSTKHGFHAAKMSMYFKKNWDLRSAYYTYRFRHQPKNSSTLILPEEAKEYGLVFEDNFDSLNTEVWSKGQPWGRFHPDNAHQFYGDPQVFVADGKLHLLNEPKPYPIIIENQPKGDVDRIYRAMRETNLIQQNLIQVQRVDAEGQVIDQNSVNYQIQQQITQVDTGKLAVMIPYSVGVVNTFHSMNFTHGFFAIRSKNPTGPATWPAWWLTGKNNWPPEIDIFEMYGKATGDAVNTQTMTVHTGKVETHTKQMMMKKLRVSEDTDSLFHIYACLWTPKKINFYTDGVIVKSIRLNRWMAQFYQEPMFLVLNNALENTYIPDLIKSGNKTSDFQVDWVQVHQLYAEETHE
jgi:beta-glucanase (GH16 family)